MDREGFLRVEQLFHEALRVPEDARAAWLREACAEDGVLFDRVRALLDRHEDGGEWPALDEAIRGHLQGVTVGGQPGPTDAAPPGAIGPYRVVRELGHGGMGVVYLARRTDVGKRVAIKLLRAPLATADLRARFEEERRILARLEHPHIAPLLDAGVTDDGTPYFALELVEGVPITDYCRRRRVDLRGRLKLVLRLCRAVQYAHRHLVVHRDIKPGNVLVTDDGRPKLLDFGVAKLLAAVDEEERPARATRIFTPAYAAPEQVTGRPVTTATDVYQIGAVLYELLAGVPPFDPGLSPAGAMRAITEDDPPPPSAAPTDPDPEGGAPDGALMERIRRNARGDLDGIILKCMEKRPERRYASVDALADDLERFLDGRPVLARPAGPLYRARRFAWRHRVVTAAAVAAVLWAGTATLQGAATARERDRAEIAAADARLEADKARTVTEFLVGLFEAGDPVEGRADTLTARDILAGAVETASALDAQPDVQATLFSVTGRLYANLGDYDTAETQLRRALDLARGPQNPDEEVVSRTLHDLGAVFVVQGRNEEAVPVLRESLRRRPASPGGADLTTHRTLAHLHTSLHALGRTAEADSVFDQWQELLRGSPVPDEGLALALKRQGQILGFRGDYPRAIAVLREAVAMHRSVYGPRHTNTADALDVLAGILLAAGEAADADSISARALELRRSHFAPPHRQLALSIAQRGRALQLQGDLAGAEPLLREAVAMEERLEGTGTIGYAARNFELATLLHDRKRFREAEERLRSVIAFWTEQYGTDYPITIRREARLAAVLRDAGRFAEAEELLVARYHRLRGGAEGPGERHVRSTLEALVDLYLAWARPDLAARYRSLLREGPSAG